MEIDRLIDLLKSRRSIRAFKPDPIPDEYIQKIIEAARWAPSGGNSQPWEFIVIKRKEVKDRIVDLFMKSTKLLREAELTREKGMRKPALEMEIQEPGFKNAPVFIVLCGDPRLNAAFPLAVYQQSKNRTDEEIKKFIINLRRRDRKELERLMQGKEK